MNMTRVRICCAILLTWALVSPVVAQEPEPSSAPGYATVPEPDASPSPGVATLGGPDYGPDYGSVPLANNYTGYVPFQPWGTRFGTRSDIGNGVGYDSGFQSFNAFQPIMLEQDVSMLFLDARVIAGYGSNFGANVGVGGRFYVPEIDRVWGLAAWYDYDDRSTNNFDQFGLSFESLGRYLDFRANAYIPNNSNLHVVSTAFADTSFFINNNIGINRARLVDTALRGGDFEIGGALPILGDYGLRTYIGGYYYEGSGSGTAYGWRSRTEAMVTEDVTMQIGVTSDPLFGTNVTGAVTLQLPDGRPSRVMSRQPTRERLYYPMQRQYRVAVHHHVINDFVLALRDGTRGSANGAIGTPIVVNHVDNTAGAGGDGSIENPFNTLPAITAADVDLIFVRRGDGTSDGYDTGITLRDNQRLLGEGLTHTFSSQQGVFTLPDNDNLGNFPILTNTAGNAVTVANNNEVSAFEIDSPTGHGIAGTGGTFDFNNLNIHDAGLGGITLTAATGAGRLVNVTTADNTLHGINIIGNGMTSLLVQGVQSTGNLGGAGLSVANSNSNLAMSIGPTLDADGITVVTPSVFSNNSGDGITLTSTDGGLTAVMTNTTIEGNGGNGFLTTNHNSNVDLTLTANTLSANALFGFELAADSGQSVVTIGGTDVADGNNFRGNVLGGIHFNLTDTALAMTNIQNNTITLAGSGGNIFLTGHDIDFHSGQNDFDTTILNFLRGQGTPDEILPANYNVAVIGSGVGSWNFTNGTQTLTGYASTTFYNTNNLIATPALWDQVLASDAVIILSHQSCGGCDLDDAGSANINSMSAAITAAINRGVDIYANAGASLATYYDFLPPGAVATGAPIGGSAGFLATPAGVAIGITDPMINGFPTHNRFTSVDPSFTVFEIRPNLGINEIISAGIQGAQITANGFTNSGDGIRIDATGNAVLQPSTILDNTITRYGDNGIILNMSGNATAQNLLIDGNTLTSTGNAINFQLTDNATAPILTVTNNQINQSSLNGILGSFTGNSTAGLTITDNDITDSTLRGIDLSTDDNAVLTAVMSNLTITGNDAGGVRFSADGASVFNASFTNNTDSSNSGIGLEIFGAGTATLNVPLNSVTAAVFDANADAGIAINLTESSTAIIPISNVTVSNTTDGTNADVRYVGQGLQIFTTDNAVLQTSIGDSVLSNTVFSGNFGDGVGVQASGSSSIANLVIANVRSTNNGSTDATTPSTADGFDIERLGSATLTPTLIRNNSATLNTGTGLFVLATGSQLPVTAMTVQDNVFSNNGVVSATNVPSGDGMSFSTGGNAILDLFATRNTVDSNARNGITLVSSQNSAIGNYLAATPAILRNNVITNNGTVDPAPVPPATGLQGDGINITFNDNSTSNIQIDGPADPAFTGRNRITNNINNGITINTDVVVLNGLTPNNTSNSTVTVLDTDIMQNGNDGINVTTDDNAQLALNIGAVGRGNNLGGINSNDGNAGDGLQITMANSSDMALNVESNIINNNALDGVRLQVGSTAGSVADFIGAGTFNNNDISFNGARGLDISLENDVGSRASPVDLVVTNNRVSGNGTEGVSIATDPHSIDNREVLLSNTGFPNDDRPFPVSPNLPQFLGTAGYRSPFQDLFTDLNANLVFTGNTVQNNGTDGLLVSVATNSYLSADVRSNTFGGNILADFRSQSILATNATTGAGLITSASINRAGVGTFDSIFLDETAQLDLRFRNNIGDDVNTTEPDTLVARQPADAGKSPASTRNEQLFQVDDGFNLDNINTFTQFPLGGLAGEFSQGGYFLRGIADPAFPNPAFPPPIFP